MSAFAATCRSLAQMTGLQSATTLTVRVATQPETRMKTWHRYACSTLRTKCLRAGLRIGPLLIALVGAGAHANTITVDNASSGSVAAACTLQDAVAAANTDAAVNGCAAGAAGADTIVFAPGITSISLATAMASANASCTFGLAVTDDLTIDGGSVAGSATPKVTIQRSSAPGTPNFGIVGASLYNCGTTPTKKLNLTLTGVAVANGNNAGNGGGVAADILTVRDSAFTGNHANDGGGVYAFTSLVMTSSTVSNNSSSFAAGIEAAGPASISGSTINGNAGTGVGGGPLTIDNSTISGNSGDGIETQAIAVYFVTITANAGAGVRLDVATGNNGTAEFDDSLIVNNAPSAPFVHDLETSASRPITGTFDYFGTLSAVAANDIDPTMRITGCAALNLGPLANNGGGTQTHALLTGSCLIDAGGIVSPGGFLFASDQRGNGFQRFVNTHADIGAFEYQGAPAVLNGACGSDNGQTLLAAPTNLCSAGTASAVSGNGHPWSWTCSSTTGGTNANCSASIKTWTVAATVSGAGGTVAPPSQTIDNGATASVTASPAPSHSLASASGCGSGTLAGNVYTTAAVTADCVVTVAFTAAPVAAVLLGSSANPAQVGQSVTLTATVTGSAATPTGTVNFYDGASYLGSVSTATPAHSGNTPSAVLNASGIATLTTTALGAGTHSISASYLGDATYAAASSNTLVESISALAVVVTPVPAPSLSAWALVFLSVCIALVSIGRRSRRKSAG